MGRRQLPTVVVAKLDRLARNVAFTSALMQSGVEFIACDIPAANKFTIHIMAAMAEEEADQISARTKAALAAYRARGGKLGAHHPSYRPMMPNVWAKGQQMGSAANKKMAGLAYLDILPIMQSLRQQGSSYRTIATRLNRIQHVTRTGKPWNQVQVMRVLGR